MSPAPPQSLGHRAGRALTRVVVTLLVLGLAGAVCVLLAEINARTFTVEVTDGRLVVLKGRLLPWGTEPFRPSEPALLDTYAPIDLQGASAGGLEGARFHERDELDRALFNLLEGLVRPKLVSDDPKTLEQGLLLLHRTERLSGLSEDQRRTLRTLQSEVAFYQARLRLDEARKSVAEAVAQLKLAGDSPTRHARAAQQMVTLVEPAAQAFEEVLRRAVYTVGDTGETASPLPVAPRPQPASDAGVPAEPR